MTRHFPPVSLTHVRAPFSRGAPPPQDCLLAAMQHGGEMEGPIKYPVHGKVATVKDPSGRLIGMWEKAEAEDANTN